MPRRNKLDRMAELYTFPNVFQQPEGIKGQWHEVFFRNNNPITVEVGCGRGEYVVNLGRRFPERNFIGVDVKGPRLWRGAKSFVEEEMPNGAFIRTLIETITDYFVPGEVDEIWVTFPDPHPQPGKARRRLVSKRFLDLYKQILKPGGHIHFKTDNADLFQWAIGTFKENPDINLIRYTDDLYNSPLADETTSIKTTYESIYLSEGKSIKYAEFTFAS